MNERAFKINSNHQNSKKELTNHQIENFSLQNSIQ